jgi:hypothetical protein
MFLPLSDSGVPRPRAGILFLPWTTLMFVIVAPDGTIQPGGLTIEPADAAAGLRATCTFPFARAWARTVPLLDISIGSPLPVGAEPSGTWPAKRWLRLMVT